MTKPSQSQNRNSLRVLPRPAHRNQLRRRSRSLRRCAVSLTRVRRRPWEQQERQPSERTSSQTSPGREGKEDGTDLFDRNVLEGSFRQGKVDFFHLASTVDRKALGRKLLDLIVLCTNAIRGSARSGRDARETREGAYASSNVLESLVECPRGFAVTLLDLFQLLVLLFPSPLALLPRLFELFNLLLECLDLSFLRCLLLA